MGREYKEGQNVNALLVVRNGKFFSLLSLNIFFSQLLQIKEPLQIEIKVFFLSL